ncbi:MAG: hypothetical protein IJJ23_11600 [Clostridia bacterium]|nr:hypothetical protein [Clostridia bacterium]
MIDFITNNAPLLFGITAAVLLLIIVLWIVISVRQGNKRREKDFEYNRETEMLKVRISELEKEATTLHERETQLLAERDSILMDAHEKADDILQQTMERIQKSEAQIRQNRIIASCCITDARRRISDLMIEVSKRLILEDGAMLDAEQVTPEAVALAEAREKASKEDFDRLTAAAAPAETAVEPDPAPIDEETPENTGTVRIHLGKTQPETAAEPETPSENEPTPEEPVESPAESEQPSEL